MVSKRIPAGVALASEPSADGSVPATRRCRISLFPLARVDIPGPRKARNRFSAGASSSPLPPPLARGARPFGASELIGCGNQLCVALPHDSGEDIWMMDHGFSIGSDSRTVDRMSRECHRHDKRRRSRATAHQCALRLLARTPHRCHRAALVRHCQRLRRVGSLGLRNHFGRNVMHATVVRQRTMTYDLPSRQLEGRTASSAPRAEARLPPANVEVRAKPYPVIL